MEIAQQAGSLLDLETPLLVVNLFEDVAEPGGATAAVDGALGGLLRRLIDQGEIRGEPCQVVIVHNPDPGRNGLAAQRVAVVGLGKRGELDLEAVRVAAASAIRKARELRVPELATVVHGAGAGGLEFADAVRALAEASLLATYDYRQYKTNDEQGPAPRRLTIVERDEARVGTARAAVELAEQVAGAVVLARDLSSAPSNLVTPTYLAERAREVAEREQLEYTLFDKERLRELGMGGLLAVNQGSAEPPCLVVLRYRAAQAGARTLAVVGKGITFDSGGISIKSAEHMGLMKHDMSGAAAVLAFSQLAAQSKAPVNVLGIFAATENLPSGTAYKPGDVHRAYNGKTMEIVNTDAEGRVILSDALSYAAEQQPDAIIDLATLTGACVVALGHYASGAMGNDNGLIELLRRAGDISGERGWPLPLWKEYEREIESPIADMKNSAGRKAGAILGAAFLKNFVGEIPWVHLDIAGTAWVEDQSWIPPYLTKSMGTGVGVRLLHEFARLWGGDDGAGS